MIYTTGENICKLSIQQWINIQNTLGLKNLNTNQPNNPFKEWTKGMNGYFKKGR